MTFTRKTFILALALLALFYMGLGAWTLTHARGVTERWVELSGDQDFRTDSFTSWIVAGSIAVTLFGLATIASCAGSIRRSFWRPRWTALAVIAPFLHFPWFFYRLIATGRVPRADAAFELQMFALRCLLICIAYAIAAIWIRRPRLILSPTP